MLIDTHCHLNFNAYREDADEVIKRSLAGGVHFINVGSQASTSRRAVEMAQKYKKGVYAAVGLHPVHLFPMEIDEGETPFKTRTEEFNLEFYKKLATKEKVVAIGETGLDYYHWPKNYKEEEVKKKQKQAFRAHLKLARELDLPVIFHCRGSRKNSEDAYEEIIEVLTEEKKLKEEVRGVIHCFGSTPKIVKAFLDLGFYISFTGIITFKNASSLAEVIKLVPLERILIETDAPYLAPEPHRGQRNEPLYVKFVAQKIAEIKGVDFSQVSEITTANARELFRLKI